MPAIINRTIHVLFVAFAILFALYWCWSFPAGAQEEHEPTIVLTIHLFLQDNRVLQANVMPSSLAECLEQARHAFDIRAYQGKAVIAVSAGCYLKVEDKPT